MKLFSKILIVVGVILMFSATGNDDMTSAHYPLVKLLSLMFFGIMLIVNGVLIGVINNND